MRSASIIFVLFVFVSCGLQTQVELDIPAEQQKLVANCFFSADSVWDVHVWKSKHALDAKNVEADRVPNATVVVKDGATANPLSYDGQYLTFRSKEKATTGKSYTLTVSAPGYETIASTVTIPEAVEIVEVKSERTLFPEMPEYYQRIFEIRFKDPAHRLNYYALSIQNVSNNSFNRENTPMLTRPLNPTFAEDYYSEWFQHYKVSTAEYNLLFNDRLFDGSDYTFKVACFEQNIDEATPLEYIIILKSIGEEYYQYRVTYNLQLESKDDPFAQPVQIYNNIQNGYGIFAGYSQSVVKHKVR
ncbi:DUF4249 domain-containing protein [Chryseolinea lacunae]|uniref:DUF4249 domain-containing protein n=1 Tax=Chryseolinea lacunae TaxID=2801331 RepID=A0ABS1KM73_9BACT|nr:DUF4249 domain-containing protein [Chryseolinea lacunae]MBL0740564.1 DUF4249 domain-containing protein [Chryseolinea lacunae]